MMFLKESMYGWGVCDIPQPRASRDIFSDRRKKDGPSSPAERRLAEPEMGPGALWASFVRRDLPGLQVMAVVSFSLAMILGVWGGSLLLPEIMAEQEPPLEIMVRLPEEPLPAPEPSPIRVTQPRPAAVPSPPKVAEVPRAEISRALPPTPKIAVPPRIVTARPEKAEHVVLPAPRIAARQYRDVAPTKDLLPVAKSIDALASDKDNNIVQPRSTASGRRYAMTGQPARSSTPSRRQAYAAGGGGTEVDLPDTTGLKRNFQLPRVRASRATATKGRSFAPGAGGAQVAIRTARGVSGNLSDAPGPMAGIAMPGQAKRSVVDRVGIAGGGDEVALPVIGGVAGKSGGAAGASSATAAAGQDIAGGSVSFGNLDQGDIASSIINLNDLRACIMPDEENRLKTDLAVALDTNGRCALRDMVFFYRNPEDMYTIWVGVQNPENFTDRCEALKAALECIHLKQ
jgi:hypothetical protein